MSDIMPASPGDTNPTAESLLEVMALRLTTGTALVEPNKFREALDAYRSTVRAEVLDEAARDLRDSNADWSDDAAAVVRDEIAEWLDRRAKGGAR